MAADILIVEDDRKIAALVAKNLDAAGLRCHAVHDGLTAIRDLKMVAPKLIVLDIGLPHLDGIELTRQIRRESDIPILMLTARTGDSDKVLGFEIGADDYLTKPFSTQELVARVRALLRRTAAIRPVEILSRGDLVIDSGRRSVTLSNQTVELTALEFDLLHFMASHPGRVYSREALMEFVWGEDRVVDPRSIDSLISRLRRKLESDPAHPRYVQTIWGAGYRFVEESS
jgi:DNA-binding response OmpR family regulator